MWRPGKFRTQGATIAGVARRPIEAVESTRLGFASTKGHPFCRILRKDLRPMPVKQAHF